MQKAVQPRVLSALVLLIVFAGCRPGQNVPIANERDQRQSPNFSFPVQLWREDLIPEGQVDTIYPCGDYFAGTSRERRDRRIAFVYKSPESVRIAFYEKEKMIVIVDNDLPAPTVTMPLDKEKITIAISAEDLKRASCLPRPSA